MPDTDLPAGFAYATSEELFEALGSPDQGMDARAVEAVVRRVRMQKGLFDVETIPSAAVSGYRA